MRYDVLVIGSNSDAIRAAVESADLGRRVALIDLETIGTAGLNLDVMQAAVDRVVKVGVVSMAALREEVARVIRCHSSAERTELACAGVDVFSGSVRFVNGNTVLVGDEGTELTADSIVLACGTKSARCLRLPLDGRTIIHAESLLELDRLPRTVIVVGAGRIGIAYSILLAKLGVEVTVIDEQSNPLELSGYWMNETNGLDAQSLNVAFRLADEVIGVNARPDSSAAVRLSSGNVLTSDVVMDCAGREGRTAGLELEAAGVGLDEHGRVWCDAAGQTWTPGIRAIGDVVGFRSGKSLAG